MYGNNGQGPGERNGGLPIGTNPVTPRPVFPFDFAGPRRQWVNNFDDFLRVFLNAFLSKYTEDPIAAARKAAEARNEYEFRRRHGDRGEGFVGQGGSWR